MNDSPAIVQTSDTGVHFSGHLDFRTVPALYEQLVKLDQAITQADLQDVDSIDSSGLALLLEWAARLHRNGKRLRVINASNNLVNLAGLCDAEEWLDLMQRPET